MALVQITDFEGAPLKVCGSNRNCISSGSKLKFDSKH